MSINSVSVSNISSKILRTQGNPDSTLWSRSPFWRTVTPPNLNEQKIVLLHAVLEKPHTVIFNISGNYTVDWGDGTTNNYNSGVRASKTFNSASYNHVNLADTDRPVTIDAAANTFNRNNHGLINGMPIILYNVAGTTGIQEGATYYVINTTANTFQLAEEKEGTPIPLINNGTAALLPYKQTIITITPQAGQNLTYLNFGNYDNLEKDLMSNLALEMHISAPNCTGLEFGRKFFNNSTITFPVLDYINIISPMTVSTGTVFSGLSNLQKLSTVQGARFVGTSAFNGCEKLQTIEGYLDFSTSTNIDYAFTGCPSLKNVCTVDIRAATSAAAMFRDARSLEQAPVLITSSALTGVTEMFSGCTALKRVPKLNLPGATNFFRFFLNCRALQEAPEIIMTAATSADTMFSGCTTLQRVPNLQTSATLTNTNSMFAFCNSLRYVAPFNTTGVTTAQSMFVDCLSMMEGPELSLNSLVDGLNMFNNCQSMVRCPIKNVNVLATSQTMFNNCYNLEYPPYIASTALNATFGMFASCFNLQYAPFMNLQNSTSVSNLFANCGKVDTIPAYNLNSANATISFGDGRLPISRIKAYNIRNSVNISSMTHIRAAELTNFMTNGLLRNSAGTATLTLPGSNYYPVGDISTYTLTGTTTSGSTTVTMANTANLAVGMEISGTNISTAVAVTLQDSGDTVTRNAHGIPNGTPVSFTSITTTTGISTYTTYYVINATTNTFQLATTVGGSAITLTNDGSGNIIYGTTITAITPNTNITLSIPASGSGSVSTTSSVLKRSIARLKGFAVSG